MRTLALACTAAVGLSLLAPATVGAAPQTRYVFGPERFERSTAVPVEQARSFVVPAILQSSLALDAWNGDPATGAARVSSAWIAIDGREVAGPALFKPIVSAFRVTLDLPPGSHRLTVRVAGAPGTFLRVALSGTIPLPDLIGARAGHTATVLSDGRVLFAGGRNAGGPLGTLEIFDPRTLAIEPVAGGSILPRADQSATLTPDGRLFLAFGADASGLVSGAEVCDVPAGTCTPTGPAGTARTGHSASLLSDGRVLLVGGVADGSPAPAETYDATPDPLSGTTYDARHGSFASLALDLAQPRWGHTATLLPDGHILVVGGSNADGELASAELVDPVTGTSTLLASGLATPRTRHTATLRADGTVLIAGGLRGGAFLRSLEVYDPVSREFSPLPETLFVARAGQTATILPDGEILVAGGENDTGILSRTELIGPAPVDDTAPAVAGAAPANGAVDIDRNALFAVIFSEPIDPASVSPISVQLQAHDAPVPGVAGIGSDGLQVFFLPSTLLAPGTEHVLVLDGLRDLAGHALPRTTVAATTAFAPEIDAFTPTHGPAGTVITITGRYFDAAHPDLNVVTIGGTTAWPTTVTPDSLQVAVPAGAAVGAAPLGVRTRGGDGESADTFLVEYPAPVLASIEPATLPAGSADQTLTARGEHFVAQSVVALAGTPLATAFVSDTVLQAVVPASALAAAGTLPVTVETPAPGGGLSAAVPLVVAQAGPIPLFLTLSPRGASITIGDEQAFAAVLTYSDGTTADVTTAAVWSSSTPSVGSIASNGLATGGAEGQTTITAVVGAVQASGVLQVSEGQPVPIDPRLIAPPLDRTSGTPIFKATEFLYTGPGAIQTGVPEGTIEPRRVSVIRGIVRTPAGGPLSGVAVTVRDHPEFGQTLTRLDGAFDLVVNGGTLVTMQYRKDGYLSADRPVDAVWQDYVQAPDVVLVPLDSRVTVVDLSSPAPVQVVQGSRSEDADGARTATLLVPQGTTANLVMPDGRTQPLTQLSVRATEFSVGQTGPDAMPAPLPAMSGYTYAAEFSVDEALAAGATDVRFSQPLVTYVENFLGFPVGSPVPLGYYDRARAVWVPSPNGRIVRVLAESGGLAVLDIDGSGQPASDAALAALGVTTPERQKVAELYEPGQTLWRLSMTHFTPWDANWPFGLPNDATGPSEDAGAKRADAAEDVDDQDRRCGGSVIECQSGTLGEVIPIVGTPFSLTYHSNRVPGRSSSRTLSITLTGGTLPPSLKRVDLQVLVAGRQFTDSFPAERHSQTTFRWDGRDAYDRPVQGSVPAFVRIGYVYDGVYREPGQSDASFGAAGGAEISGSPTRREVTAWQGYETALGTWDVTSQGGGGWSLDVHHAYDTWAGTLYLGDGERRSAANVGSTTIKTIAGGGVQMGDTGHAADLRLDTPNGLRAGADGSVYVSDANYAVYPPAYPIYRIRPDGTYVRVVSDVGVAAVVAPDGSLYTADTHYNHHQINRIDPDGTVTRVAGLGPSGFSGDNGPAIDARLSYPSGVALAPDGTLYIADASNCRIRRVGTDGIITTSAGTGQYGYGGDGGPATDALIKDPYGLAVGPDGSLYIADLDNARIRRVGPDGIITTVAGRGVQGYDGDGGPATLAALDGPTDVAVGRDGSLYITEFYDHRVRRVGTDGVITTVAGNGLSGFAGDTGPAAAASLKYPSQATVAPDGSVYVADRGNDRIRQLDSALPSRVVGALVIPSDDGAEVYDFDDTGRHLRTADALTGATLYSFEYSPFGYVTAIVDGDGNRTTIVRDPGGTPTAIVAPGGQRTTLVVDTAGYLSEVRDPMGQTVAMTYSSDGLLTSFTDARHDTSQIEYDADGRLTRDTGPAGGFQAVSRDLTDGHVMTTITTAEGRASSYDVEPLSTGNLQLVNTDASGLVTTTTRRTDGARVRALVDGSTLTIKQTGDPRFGMQAPITSSIAFATPGGLSSTATATRTVSLSEPGNPLSVVWLEDSLTPSQTSGTYVSRYTASTRQVVTTTPTGRQTVSTLDALGRVTEWRAGTLTPVQFVYDAKGRLTDVVQGARRSTIAYDAQNRPTVLADALSREVHLAYDAADRLIAQTLPDGRRIDFEYDANGNIIALTPPGRPTHRFGYTPVDLVESYTPPAVSDGGVTAYEYNRDRDLTVVARPGPSRIAFTYDAGGRMAGATFDGGAVHYTYAPTGQVATIATDAGVGLAYTFDGPLPVAETWSGGVSAAVTRTFTDRFFVASERVNGGAGVSFGYDGDGLLTQAGALTITRDGVGLPAATALGGVTDRTLYNEYGEATHYTATAVTGAGPLVIYDEQMQRDALGRITARMDVTPETIRTFQYDYDAAGRLATVQTGDGALVAAYDYDPNGNRIQATGPLGSVTATYDDQDRLLTYGTATYTYTPNGELATKTTPAGVTTYTYDALGNLLRVVRPDGTDIRYLVDGRNRRVGKLVNGTFVRGSVYGDQLRPIAELDATGAVTARFVYGTRPNVPDYLLKGGVTYRIVSDHLGSPRVVVDTSTGAIVQRMDYDAFGVVTYDSAPGWQPFGFAGGLYDPDTQLVRFGARDYDAETGRWTSKDPIGFKGLDHNLFGYVMGDPLNAIDPLGLWKYASEYKTTGEGLSATMKGIEPFVDVASNDVIGEDATVTYTTNGKHKTGSLHYKGDAIDLRTRDMTAAQRRDFLDGLREVLGEGFDVIDEGDHIHVEYDPEWRKQKPVVCK